MRRQLPADPLLTGARREELAGLSWADVDFKWKSLSIADTIEAASRPFA